MLKRSLLFLIVCLAVLSASTAQDDIGEILDRDPGNPAVVLYVWTPDETYAAAAGLVQIDGSEAATVEDRFRIGSVSKTYTAVTTLQLVDDGLIELDEPISTYLPADLIANLDGADAVTVRQLLNMSSGLYEYLQDDFYAAVDDNPTYTWTPEETLARFAYGEDALFEAGTDFEYTNTNYLLLELIVESVTDEPLFEVMRENIFDPIGADDTYTQIQESLPGEFVHGYEDLDGDGDLDDAFAINDGAGMGDGGLIANAEDVALFYKWLLYDGELLEDDTLEAMLTDEMGSEYGLGIEVIQDDDYGMVYGHSGSVLGFTSDVRYFWEEDIIVVLLHADLELDDSVIYEAVDWVLE